MTPGAEDAGVRGPARALVAVALALLVIPGLVGFDVWPLTAWRLFSLSRADQQTRWVLEVVAPDTDPKVVSLEALPLPYRTAEWPLADLPRSGEDRRDEVCGTLLDAVMDVEPDAEGLRIVRDRQRQVRRGGHWVVEHDPTLFHACDRGDIP